MKKKLRRIMIEGEEKSNLKDESSCITPKKSLCNLRTLKPRSIDFTFQLTDFFFFGKEPFMYI